MRCLVCGTVVPDGETACPECGVVLTSETAEPDQTVDLIGWNPDGTPLYGDRKKLKGKYRGTRKPLRMIYICEMILVSLNLLALPLSEYVFWNVLGYLNGNRNNYDKIEPLGEFLEKYMWVLSLVVIALMIVMAVAFSMLQYYESGFRKALYAGVIMVVMRLIAESINAKIGIAMMLSLGSTIATCAYYYIFFQALEDYTRSGFPKMANTWKWLKAVFMAIIFVKGLLEICAINERISNFISSSWSYFTDSNRLISQYRTYSILTHVETWIGTILIVIEAWMIRKTYKLCVSSTRRRRIGK